MKCSSRHIGLLASAILLAGLMGTAQSHGPGKSEPPEPLRTLQRRFFTAIRNGDSQEILSYISPGGVNLGSQAQHASREEVTQHFATHTGLYCKLFDSSCVQASVNLENSARVCSYRELLTHSQKVRTAASEVTRNGVQQAVLVAQVQNDNCPNQKLIDVIFNLEADGWKLFSIP